MSKGREYLNGLTDFATPNGTIAPPIEAPPRIQDFFKAGVSLSKTFKDWDAENAAWARRLLEYQQRESFKPEISDVGDVGSGGEEPGVVPIPVVPYPVSWFYAPVIQNGADSVVDFENATWGGPVRIRIDTVRSSTWGGSSFLVSVPNTASTPEVVLPKVELQPRATGPFRVWSSFVGFRSEVGVVWRQFAYHLVTDTSGDTVYTPSTYIPAASIYVEL